MQEDTWRSTLKDILYSSLYITILKLLLQSGLTEACRQSKLSVADAENQILNFLEMHTNPRECPLAGNSVGEDKRFLYRYMPKLINHLHYRIVDVSTVKELCR